MRLSVRFRTRYDYGTGVRQGLTAARLVPSSRPGLSVLSAQLAADPGRVVVSYRDGWGTRVDLVESAGTHTSLQIEAAADVETFAAEWSEPLTAAERSLYSATSERVPIDSAPLIGWQIGGAGASWPAVESALGWLPQRFYFSVGQTDAETTLAEFVERGAGVCQDFAHAFLVLLRAWGWPARYVSGYCFNAEPPATTIEAEASHAWVEVYHEDLGWVGLDPSAGTYTDDRYVPVGVGRDYDDVRPVRGVFRGVAAQRHTSHLQMQMGQPQQ